MSERERERIIQSDGSFSDRDRGRQVQQDHVRQKQKGVRQSDREWHIKRDRQEGKLKRESWRESCR